MSEAVEVGGNTNVSVGVSEGDVLKVGATAPSFDDLLAVGAPKPNGEKFADKEGLENKKETKDNRSQEKPDKKEATKADAKDDSQLADADKQKLTRFIKAKQGDAELELQHDTVIPTKVAGSLENPTLEELQANYSGKINWDRKYKEFATERTSFESERKELNSLVESMTASVKEDPFKFFDVVGEITGQDSVALKMQAIDEQIELGKKFAQMSPQQIEQFKKDMALKFREDTLSAKETRIRNHETQKTKAQELAKVRESYQIDESTWQDTEEAAREVYGRDVTPEEVVHTRKYLDVLDAMNSVNPDLVSQMTEDKKRFALDLTKMAFENPWLKPNDLKDFVQSAFGSSRGERLAKKIKDSQDTKGRVKTPEGQGKVLYSFDQL